jgi:hypothetical protein
LEGSGARKQPATIVARFAAGVVSTVPEEIARYAGGSGYKMDADTREMASRAIDRAMDLIAPAMAYAVHPAKVLSSEGQMQVEDRMLLTVPSHECDPQTRFLVAAVCTIGPALEAACRELAEQKDFLSYLLLDAAGVALLEALSQKAHDLLSERAAKARLFCGCRFAPGYGTMPMSGQSLLFRLVDAEAICVRLNKRMVMNPGKSLSFFTRWTKKALLQSRAYKCRTCPLDSCPFRIRNTP